MSTVDQIANAILYEGYILYPYRASSKRNGRGRFGLGRVYPKAFSEITNGTDPCVMQTECLIQACGGRPRVKMTLGFLQPIMRHIGAFEKVLQDLPETRDIPFRETPEFEAGGRQFQAWMEAIERKVSIVAECLFQSRTVPFAFPASEGREAIHNENGEVAGVILRQHEMLEGRLQVKFTRLQKDLFRLSVRVLNTSAVPDLHAPQAILLRTFASTHFSLELEHGEFVSLLETPPALGGFASDCQNIGCWPVLIGDQAARERTTILACPIMLNDYPKIEKESAVDFSDSAGTDGLPGRTVLALPDEENRQTRKEQFCRTILQRTASQDMGHLPGLDGAKRESVAVRRKFFDCPQPVKAITVAGTVMKVGDRVTVRPRPVTDVFDMLLAGKVMIIEALEQDLDGHMHVAVVLEKNPGPDLEMSWQPRHCFFYRADEIEPLSRNDSVGSVVVA